MAPQRLGQHFLVSAAWRQRMARLVLGAARTEGKIPIRDDGSEHGELWIEIGAGHGEMTAHLLRSGAPVIAVELDPPLVERLQKLTQSHPNLTVIHSDVLKTDLAALAAGRRMRIYGNLPYYITSPILHHFFAYAPQIDEAHIVIQLEVAQRLTAKPGSKLYGYLSVATQFYSRPDFALRLPRGAFRFPGAAGQPGIGNALAFMEFVKMCFAQKRKTLSNNLRGIAEPGRVREILRALKLREDARAEQLTVGQLAELYGQVESKK